MFAFSCSSESGGSGGGATGTITVTDTADWTNMKIGFFPEFGSNDGLDDDSQARAAGGEEGYLTFYDVGDDSGHEMIATTQSDIAASTSLSQSYSFTLPTSPQVSTDETTYTYQLAVWIDADADDMLDLNDSWSSTLSGEFNRLPLKDIDNANPSYIYSWTYVENAENFLTGTTYTGYKFNGWDGSSSTTLMTTADYGSSGYNFEISP